MDFDAAGPSEIAGPAFDGAERDADLPGDGGVAAAGAEFQVSAEGFKGPVRFPRDGREPGSCGRGRLRVSANRGCRLGDQRVWILVFTHKFFISAFRFTLAIAREEMSFRFSGH